MMVPSLSKRLLTSTGWSASAAYACAAVAFIGNVFLARLVLPTDFGVYALASSFVSLVLMISGFGSQEAIVQCRNDTIRELIPTAFWISTGLGLSLALAGSCRVFFRWFLREYNRCFL